MNVEGEITERDSVRAQWLHMKPRRGYRIAGYVVLALFSVACVLLIVISTSLGDPAPAATLLGPVALILLAGALLRWQFQRIYRRQPSLQGTHSYQFTDAGFLAVSPHGRGGDLERVHEVARRRESLPAISGRQSVPYLSKAVVWPRRPSRGLPQPPREAVDSACRLNAVTLGALPNKALQLTGASLVAARAPQPGVRPVGS